MPHLGKCKNCGKSFQGRSDQKYCSNTCKNDYNNGLKSKERVYINRDVESLAFNIKILNQVLDPLPYNSGQITKAELAQKGFDLEGPFRILDSNFIKGFKYRVGKYDLFDTGIAFSFERWKDDINQT